MKLSEAIRLGSMLHPQTRGGFSVSDLDGNVIGTCALGAALVAIRMEYRGLVKCGIDPVNVLRRQWPYLANLVQHPAIVGVVSLDQAIITLNDKRKWPREQIADWVATVEESVPVPVEEELVNV